MRSPILRLFGILLTLVMAMGLAACAGLLPKSSPMRAQQNLRQTAMSRLTDINSSPGAPMMIRIFKQTKEFEVWKQSKSGEFRLFRTYEICAYSGGLGPKVKEGDRQSPEGIYNITPGLMNPNSNYYLAFNTGFPNKFDRAWGRTGSELMVHGDCSSRGCYSMTDEGIAEIYALARETFAAGNTVIQMQIFPFRMTPKALAQFANDATLPFWMNIKEGYDRFELNHQPPDWDVCEKKYVFGLKGPGGAPLDAAGACPARGDDPLWAALQARQQADDAAFKLEVAAINDRNAKLTAAQQAAAAEAAAAKARGQAIGGFISGLTGGDTPPASSSSPDSGAPVPMPPPSGA